MQANIDLSALSSSDQLLARSAAILDDCDAALARLHAAVAANAAIANQFQCYLRLVSPAAPEESQ